MFLAMLLMFQTVTVPVVGAAKLIEVAGVLIPVVYIIVQLIKLALPNISGVWAIVFNFVLSALAYVIALPQAQWFTMTTLMALAVTVAGAAGIHGTVKSLSAPTPPPALPPSEIPLVQNATPNATRTPLP